MIETIGLILFVLFVLCKIGLHIKWNGKTIILLSSGKYLYERPRVENVERFNALGDILGTRTSSVFPQGGIPYRYQQAHEYPQWPQHYDGQLISGDLLKPTNIPGWRHEE